MADRAAISWPGIFSITGFMGSSIARGGVPSSLNKFTYRATPPKLSHPTSVTFVIYTFLFLLCSVYLGDLLPENAPCRLLPAQSVSKSRWTIKCCSHFTPNLGTRITCCVSFLPGILSPSGKVFHKISDPAWGKLHPFGHNSVTDLGQ